MCLGSPDARLMAKITTDTTNSVTMDMKNLRTRNRCIFYSPGLFPITGLFSQLHLPVLGLPGTRLSIQEGQRPAANV